MQTSSPSGVQVWSEARLSDPTLVVTDDDIVGVEFDLPAVIRADVSGYHVELRAVLIDGRVAVERLMIARRDGGSAVTAEALRRISLADLLDELMSSPKVAYKVRRSSAALTARGRPWERAKGVAPPSLLAEAKRRADPGMRRTRATLERVATAYRSAPTGERLAAVAARLSVSTNYAKKLIREAREAGVLEHSSRSGSG